MKFIKYTFVFTLILFCVFAFKKRENTSLDLRNIDVKKLLTKQQFECRPSSKYLFYVNTEVLKKSRGYSTIKADVYIYERATGKYNLLASENMMSPFTQGAVLQFSNNMDKVSRKTLSNGDRIIGNSESTNFKFSELIQYKTIYDSYLTSRDGLLRNN